MEILQQLPLFMLCFFLIINLVVGYAFAKQAATFKEYAIGSRQFSTSVLVATILATRIEGGQHLWNWIFCAQEKGFSIGVLLGFFFPVCFFLM